MTDERDPAADRIDSAPVRMRILGEDRELTIPVPLGRRTMLEVLPAARRLTEQAVGVAIDQHARQGHSVSCAAGCSACCRHLVAVSPVEAQDLADVVAALPPDRQAAVRERFAEAKRRFESVGLLAAGATPGDRSLQAGEGANHSQRVHNLARHYFEAQIPCPFLEDDSCSVYDHRPMVCREHHVTSPAANCANLDGAGVEAIRPPLDMAPALARAGGRALGMKVHTLPLILALEWSERNGGPLRERRDGLELLTTLIEECDRHFSDSGSR